MTGTKYVSWCLALLLRLAAVAGLADDGQFLYNGFAGVNLTLYGAARITPNGLLKLTNGTVQQTGHAFYPPPVRLRRTPSTKTNGTGNEKAVRSFSSSFVFGIVTADTQDLGGHGVVLVVAPRANLSTGLANNYMGLFNGTGSVGSASNHLFAVELDTIQNPDFRDINNNHVGININDLASRDNDKAGYYDDDDGRFHDMTLISGDAMQVWVDYDGDTTRVNVTLAPLGVRKPARPLLSATHDLSTVIVGESYIGFSSATGTLSTQHYVLGWSFGVDMPAPTIDAAKLPKMPKRRTRSDQSKTMVIALPILSVVLLLFMVSCVILVRKRYNYGELREDWEVEFGPHRIPYKDLRRATERFKNKNLLGVGGFGRVYKGVLPKSRLEVAVKRVSHESRQGMKEFVAKVVSIGRLRHRNIVQLLGYCRLKNELLLIYDYMPNGSLDKYLYGHNNMPVLSWAQRFLIIKGIASGLYYLHEEWEQVVVHRDIKASNVLLDSEMNARLGDFGLAKLYNHGSDMQTTIIAGTLGYLAPEITRTGKASPLTDVFAFGVFLLEVTTGRKPVERDTEGGIHMLVDLISAHLDRETLPMDMVDPRLEGEYNTDEASLVLKLGLLCSHPLPDLRPSMRQVMQYLDGQLPFPELVPSHTSFSMLSMAQSRGLDSYAISKSLSSMASISQLSSFSSGR
ncbi:L-type lectin-domain containing receptor kinase SIT1-like [Oryza glaberrima]|uniref:L-type lectin-domain containing receptor kinase SIT1-like n=1 Tax=Oryza glaberrima TaxID=4538 RepID=UPI00224BED50|nr:L-type lectin-domain containing receptor kinase SIT1-like [Oryza glaberrima]